MANDFYCSKAKGVGTPEVCDALWQVATLAPLVKPSYSASSLKAWVKEHVDNDEPIPSFLDDLLHYDTVPRIKSRRT